MTATRAPQTGPPLLVLVIAYAVLAHAQDHATRMRVGSWLLFAS